MGDVMKMRGFWSEVVAYFEKEIGEKVQRIENKAKTLCSSTVVSLLELCFYTRGPGCRVAGTRYCSNTRLLDRGFWKADVSSYDWWIQLLLAGVRGSGGGYEVLFIWGCQYEVVKAVTRYCSRLGIRAHH
ncbi:hypothetical protein Tco_0751441 [Tanacetum coccineum]|uniref:Uncharacterized protein n=1 Tax=Tanacetum coccineum TaxID=301880 RepID=A0ABQ4Z478_9ASTR